MRQVPGHIQAYITVGIWSATYAELRCVVACLRKLPEDEDDVEKGGGAPRKRQRVKAYSWLLRLDNALKIRCGTGLAFYQVPLGTGEVATSLRDGRSRK